MRVRFILLISIPNTFPDVLLEFVKVSQVLICADWTLLTGFIDDAVQVANFSISNVLNNLTQCDGLCYVKDNYCSISDVTE